MNLIILGAGQVGTTVARHLSREDTNLTVVDHDRQCLNRLQSQLDLKTVLGNAAHPRILREAGAQEADIILAVTNSDETNMIACQVAYTLFQTPTKIARVRCSEYLIHEDLFGTNALPIDVIISPEQLVANHVYQLIVHPEAIQVLDFADQRAKLIHVKMAFQAPLAGQPVNTLCQLNPHLDIRIAAIFRKNRPIFPTGKTPLKPNDEIFFLCRTEDISEAISLFKNTSQTAKTIFIAGGGNIGAILAEKLDPHFQVKIIEHNPDKIEHLAIALENTLILKGEATDQALLIQEHVSSADIFCTLTNNDEHNMLSAMLAKKLGAKKALALINRAAYIHFIDRTDIDIPISPQQITISSLLSHVRQGDVVKVHSLEYGRAEALETIVHGTKTASEIIGRSLDDIQLPKEATIVAIVRAGDVLMAHRTRTIQEKDHVILFVTDNKAIAHIERLFQTEMLVF